MVRHDIASDETLAAVLHRYAQRAPARQLGAEIGIGITIAAAAICIRPGIWIILASVGVAIATLGLWSWADRAVDAAENVGHDTRGWKALRALAAVVGAVSVMLTAFVLLAKTLGTWIS